MSNPGKARGTAFETDLVKYLREHNLEADRLTLQGSADEGDVLLRVGDRRFVFEAKNRKQMNLAGWMAEAAVERTNYALARGLLAEQVNFAVAHKRRGKGIAEAFITLPLYEYIGQISG